jgi:hypothetical protein
MRLATFLIVALLSHFPGTSNAQVEVGELRAGARVRATLQEVQRPVVGVVVHVTPDSLTVLESGTGSHAVLSRAAIEALELSQGRDVGSGAMVGALVGLFAGIGLGVACVSVCSTNPADGANMAPAGAFLLGPPAGALIGAVLAPERWRRLVP